MSNIHPTSKLIFDFLDETGMDGANLYPFLRLFIAGEYDRDPSVADRLKVALAEIKEALEDPPEAFRGKCTGDNGGPIDDEWWKKKHE